jgi:hypothetical protein
MTIFNKRNALLGFATLEAMKFRRRTKKRKASKIALYLGLGLVSAGILAAVVAVLLRRRNGDEKHELQGYAVGEDADPGDKEPTASSEPIPAT